MVQGLGAGISQRHGMQNGRSGRNGNQLEVPLDAKRGMIKKKKGRPGISNTRLDNKTDIDARMENGMGNPGSPMRKTWKTTPNFAF